MGMKIAVIIGIALIMGTASLMILPFTDSPSTKNEGPKNAFEGTFQNMRSAEEKMNNFINQEKTEIAAQLQQFSIP